MTTSLPLITWTFRAELELSNLTSSRSMRSARGAEGAQAVGERRFEGVAVVLVLTAAKGPFDVCVARISHIG